MREDHAERGELKLLNLSLSGNVSCDSMVVNKPPDEVSATRSGLLLHTATVKETKAAAAHTAKSVEEAVVSFAGDVNSDLMIVNRPPNIVSIATRSVQSVEDQVAAQWSVDVLSEGVLFGGRPGSYSSIDYIGCRLTHRQIEYL